MGISPSLSLVFLWFSVSFFLYYLFPLGVLVHTLFTNSVVFRERSYGE